MDLVWYVLFKKSFFLRFLNQNSRTIQKISFWSFLHHILSSIKEKLLWNLLLINVSLEPFYKVFYWKCGLWDLILKKSMAYFIEYLYGHFLLNKMFCFLRSFIKEDYIELTKTSVNFVSKIMSTYAFQKEFIFIVEVSLQALQ